MTRTSRYVASHPDKLLPTVQRPDTPPDTYVLKRLSNQFLGKRQSRPNELTRQILAGGEGTRYFCDTSLFDGQTESSAWDALLARRNQIVLVPEVLKELSPWVAQHQNHPMVDVIRAAGSRPNFYAAWHPDLIHARNYYVRLLVTRKLTLDMRVWEFSRRYGRNPDEAEFAIIKDDLHRKLGPRGYLLATKGYDAKGKANFGADEELVVCAAMDAILTGNDTYILTKDEDIEEQLYKLQWLLGAHYRGMLLAAFIASGDPIIKTFPWPPEIWTEPPSMDEVFHGADARLFRRNFDRDSVLPPSPKTVAVTTLVTGVYVSAFTTILEHEMAPLLHTKGQTHGLNTTALNGFNCHIWLAPWPIKAEYRDCGAIVRDIRYPSGLATGPPNHDLHQAIYCGELDN